MSDDAFKALEADITTLLFDGPWPADRETIVRLELKVFCAWAAGKSPGQARSHAINAAWESQKLDLLITFAGLWGRPAERAEAGIGIDLPTAIRRQRDFRRHFE